MTEFAEMAKLNCLIREKTSSISGWKPFMDFFAENGKNNNNGLATQGFENEKGQNTRRREL